MTGDYNVGAMVEWSPILLSVVPNIMWLDHEKLTGLPGRTLNPDTQNQDVQGHQYWNHRQGADMLK